MPKHLIESTISTAALLIVNTGRTGFDCVKSTTIYFVLLTFGSSFFLPHQAVRYSTLSQFSSVISKFDYNIVAMSFVEGYSHM